MKNLFSLVCLVVLLGVSVNVMGQGGTGIAPQVGTTHPYSVTPNGSNTFSWDVTTDFQGALSVKTNAPTSGTVATLSALDGASITITWVNPIVGTTYFVHIIETADGTTCVNRKALAVKPVNAFVLTVASVTLTDADDQGDAYKICPPIVTVSSFPGTAGTTLADAQNFVYDYDASVIYYKITASGINTTLTGWSPQFTIGHTQTSGASVTAGWSTSVGGTYTSLTNLNGSTANDIIVPANNPSIWVKVTIDNGTSTAGLEGTADQVATLTLLNAVNTSEDANGNDVTALTVPTRVQTVNARPATTPITTTEP